jgi:non-lysosomal glucosylceramidase
VRERHDGLKRNPWNEFECGNHYARSMANYAYLLALSGFRYSAPQRTLYLNPALCVEDFRTFFSVEGAWGTIGQRRQGDRVEVTVEVVEGTLAVERVVLGGTERE